MENNSLSQESVPLEKLPPLTEKSGGFPAAVPPFDPHPYWAYLDGMDLSDDQKADLLKALWSIMSSFVALGFGVDPVQKLVPALMEGTWVAESDGVEQKATRQSFNGVAGLHDEDENNNLNPPKENGHG